MEVKVTIVVCIILFLIGGFCGYKYVYIPQMKQIENKKEQLSKEIEKNEVTYDISKLKEKLKKYAAHFPNSKDTSKFISTISNKVDDAEVEVLSITPQNAAKYKKYSVLPVRLHLRTNFHKLGEFVSILEGSKKYIGISLVNIKKLYKGGSGSKGVENELENRKGQVISGVTMDLNTFVFESIE